MKQQFKTQAEIYQALLDGKKIKHKAWGRSGFVHLVDGTPCSGSGTSVLLSFNIPEEWSIYEEPKKPRKLVAFECKDGDVRFVIEGSDHEKALLRMGWKRAPGFDMEEKV